MISLLLPSGAYDLRAIMVRAVAIARLGGSRPWSRRMVAGLRFAWSAAKAELHRAKVAAGQVRPKLTLGREAAFGLLARIKGHAVNRHRNVLDGLHRATPLGIVLQRARDKYARVPAADRAGLLHGLTPETGAVRVRAAQHRGWSWGR